MQTYESNINSNASSYEKLYGTDKLNSTFGKTIGATDGYSGYQTIGGITGTSNTAYEKSKKEADQTRAANEAALKNEMLTGAFLSRI